MHVLAETPTVRILYEPRGSHTVVATFSHMDFDASVHGAYWGRGALEQLGFDAVGVVCKGNHWFPNRDMVAAVRAIGPLPWADTPRRVAYGSSMGGYGALKHGRLIGADVALAMSPQFSITPLACRRWDARYRRFFRWTLNLGSTVTRRDMPWHSFVFVDRRERVDLRHADALSRRGATIIAMPSMGHETVAAFLSADQLRALIEAACSGSHKAVLDVAADGRRRSHGRVFALAERLLAQGDVAMADRLIEAYCSAAPAWQLARWIARRSA